MRPAKSAICSTKTLIFCGQVSTNVLKYISPPDVAHGQGTVGYHIPTDVFYLSRPV